MKVLLTQKLLDEIKSDKRDAFVAACIAVGNNAIDGIEIELLNLGMISRAFDIEVPKPKKAPCGCGDK